MWLLSASVAMAAACPKEMKALDAAKGEAVAGAFSAVVQCDAAAASGAFAGAMKRTGDVDSLAALTFAALDANLTSPVVGMLEQIPDYAARTELAEQIGANCQATPSRAAFVKSLTELKGRAFVAWVDAVGGCAAPEIDAALEGLLAAPPKASFDDKYSAVVDLYARRQHAAGLPKLEAAAIAALEGGPVALLVEGMQRAITPSGIGVKPSDADRDALVASLGRVGANASPEVARSLAQTLVKVGAEDAAVALLPKIHPTKVQANGGFLYGLAAIEKCGDASVVHYATLSEPGKRWSVQQDAGAKAQAFKHKLKCGAEWQVQVSAEPVASAEEVATWAQTFAGEGGKLKAEKPVALD
jgi:hypothetical protein